MGIQYLWTILGPFCERKPLYHLQGKTVAVDLSCWVCEAQNVSEYEIQPRMYLRNLYFRTSYLLLMEVIPIFVLEGKAPQLKYDTIAARNEIRFKGAKPKTDKVKTGKDRTRFHHILKRCEEMIGYMGLACVKGEGEAESMCAYLNDDGLVAGCISQDSDCFAYGAKVVFRNFSISSQGNQSASGGAVDVYDIQKAYETLKFGRNKIITLALLCGSDYNDGVHGVGKESAIKFMSRYRDEDILEHMRSWRRDDKKFKELESKIANKKICTSCGHKGTVQAHSKSGCSDCTTTKGCDFSRFREQRLEIKNEIAVGSKALADPNFPNEELISEYLTRKDDVQKLDLKWKQPNLVAFVKFTNKFLNWEEIYAFEKFLPILTRWQLLNYKYIQECINRGCSMEIKGTLKPDFIKKVRNPKGIPSYEIIWKDSENCFEHLIPEEQLEKYMETNKEVASLWSTIEPQNLVSAAYPNLVETFLESKTKKDKKVTKRKKCSKGIEELSDMLANTSISEPKVKKTRKKLVNTNQKTLENFLAISKPKRLNEKSESLDDINEKLKKEMKKSELIKENETIIEKPNALTKKQKTLKEKPKTLVEKVKIREIPINSSFDLDASSFGDENDCNLSDIIENIINQVPQIPDKIKKLGYTFKNYHLENLSPIKIDNKDPPRRILKPNNFSSPIVKQQKNRRSSFFEINQDEDLFEKLLEKNSSDEELNGCENQDDYLGNLSDYDNNLKEKSNLNESSFFETNFKENDLFEKSLRKEVSSESDDTVEYDYEGKEKIGSDSDDDFYLQDLDVPLIERIKNKK